ncbi:MAG TPA: amidohydrolase family protein [Polyangia bacterium]|jgi:predicted TIM-barrel fold metal-dependent hydrolase|nr:amidohydrolase family protein [Polyangia bacterium]
MSRRSLRASRPAPPRGPTRRAIIAGAAAAWSASCLPRARPAAPAPRFDQPIVVDVHCHDFNASDLPITGFIARTVPGLAELSRSVSPWPEQILRKVVGTIHGWLNAAAPTAGDEAALLQSLLAQPGMIEPVAPLALPAGPIRELADQIAGLLGLDPAGLRDQLTSLAGTLHLVGHGRARLAATLATSHPRVALFTPLLVDYDAWSDDHPASPLGAQLAPHALLARLAMRGRVGRAGALFHPFVAFDPLREVQQGGALAIVRRAIERSGFVGVKIYPTVGFLPIGNAGFGGDRARGQALDGALRALYAYCAAEEVPITTHASPSNQFALGYGELAAPMRWAPVLREFPTLRLNFGHFGHDTGAAGAAGITAPSAWMRQAAEIIQAHPQVYADLSGSPLVYDPAYAARFGGYLQTLCARFPRLPARLMYGSDWWLSRFDPGGAAMAEAFEARLDSWLGAPTREAIMGRNALRFLGLLDDDDRLLLDNRNRMRLRGFHGAAPAPAWLG